MQRSTFTGERGESFRIVDGDPESRYFLEQLVGEKWVTYIFQHTTTQMAVGSLCRELIRTVNPNDPSL